MGQTLAIEHIYFYVPLDSGTLVLASMSDSTFRILRDDEPVPGKCWKPTEIKAATNAFQEMSAKLKQTH